MKEEVQNKNKDCEFHGPYVGRDQITTNIILFQDNEREFVVTHNADIKPVTYFTGRKTELQDLRQRIEEGRKSVLVSGMGGIGKTHICRKLFEEYYNRYDKYKNEPFRHIGYIEYNKNMDESLKDCLKYKKQEDPKQNQEAAWRELEYLASNGKFLLFVDNVNVSMGKDPGLKRLMSIPGAIVITSRRRMISKEFEPYRIGFLSTEQCREIYEKILYENSGKRIAEEDVPNLEYIVDTLVARHTITVEFLAHLAQTKHWTVQRLRDELERNGFRLEYMDEEDKLVNIQESYEILYDMSVLSEAEQNILEAFSMFPYTPLDVETCNLWLLEDAGVSGDDGILNMLYRKGWLQYDVEQNGYSMHPVFAQFIYEKTKPNVEMHCGLFCECQFDLRISKVGCTLEYQKNILFAEHIIRKVYIEKENEWVNVIACSLYYIKKYEKAKELSEKSLHTNEKIFGFGNENTVMSYNNLASVYKEIRRYDEAEKMYEKSLQISKSIWGEEHHKIAICYANLANLYDIQGRYDEAEELYERSLHINKKVLGEWHLETANSYNTLGDMYRTHGKNEVALSYVLKAYSIYKHKCKYRSRLRNSIIHAMYEDMKSIYNEWNPKGDFEQWLEEKMKE